MVAPWILILVRAASTAFIVVLASGLAEAFGPFWGALVTSLPISSGPAYVFLAMEHDDVFIAAAALSSFTTHAAIACFVVTYALTAVRLKLWQGLGLSLLAWLVVASVLRQFSWTPLGALALNVVCFSTAFFLLRGVAQQPHQGGGTGVGRRWYDLPLRAITVATLVTFVVLASDVIGPSATGMAAVFPISLSSLFVILRPRIGATASAMLAANALRGMVGFGATLFTLVISAVPLGATRALILAMVVSIVCSGAMLALRRTKKP